MKIEYRPRIFMSGPGKVLYIRLSKWTIVKVNKENYLIDFHSDCNFIKRNVTKLKTMKREHFRMLNILAGM